MFEFCIILLLLLNTSTLARPISYSGGTTIMQNNGPIKHNIHIHYPALHLFNWVCLGAFRNDDVNLNGLQLNYLISVGITSMPKAIYILKQHLGVQSNNHDLCHG